VIALDFWHGREYNLHNLKASPSKSNLEKARYNHGCDQEVTRETGNPDSNLPPFPFSEWAGLSRGSILPLPVDSGERFFFEIEDTNVPGSHL
jgi:hypothetical protein